MRRNRAARAITRTESRGQRYRSSLWSIRIPSDASPLSGENGLRIESESAHAFFLLCCELYRVIELNHRNLSQLIETYSRFRTREHFRDSLSFRYFDSELSGPAAFDPDLAARVGSLFNLIHELRVSISFTDALPHTVRAEIERVLLIVVHEWNLIAEALRERKGWEFKTIEPRISI